MAKPRKSSAGREKNAPKAKPVPAPISCEVQTTTAFKRAVKKLKLSDAERQDLIVRIKEVGNQFGKPHQHQGLGIRALGSDLYECRSGLDVRLVFVKDSTTKPPTLFFPASGPATSASNGVHLKSKFIPANQTTALAVERGLGFRA